MRQRLAAVDGTVITPPYFYIYIFIEDPGFRIRRDQLRHRTVCSCRLLEPWVRPWVILRSRSTFSGWWMTVEISDSDGEDCRISVFER